MEPMQGQQTPRSQYLAQLLAQGAQGQYTTPQQVGTGLAAQALGQYGANQKPGHMMQQLGGLFHMGSGYDMPGQFNQLAKQFRPGG
jgi:hypothetical protein